MVSKADNPSGTVPEKKLEIRRVELRRMAFEAAPVPHLDAAKIDWENVDLRINCNVNRLKKNYALIMTANVHAKSGEDTAFWITVEEVGMFAAQGYAEEEVENLLRTKGAAQLYPFVREVILSTVARCGLPNLGLTPFPFDVPKLESSATD
jgi:protein-export chaperone SecB